MRKRLRGEQRLGGLPEMEGFKENLGADCGYVELTDVVEGIKDPQKVAETKRMQLKLKEKA